MYDDGDVFIGDGDIMIAGEVECSNDGCPAPEEVASGSLFNKETHQTCEGSANVPGEEGSVCAASVRGILHPVLCTRTHRCCITWPGVTGVDSGRRRRLQRR